MPMNLAEEIALILSQVDWDVSERYGISLKVHAQEKYISGRTQGYRLYVEAENPRHMSRKIFVYQLKPGVDDEGRPITEFTNVASPADLEEYPPDNSVGVSSPFFRLAYIDLVFRNPELLLEAFQGLVSDVVELVLSLDYMDDIALAGTIDIGNPSKSSSSSSSSSPSVSSSSSSWPHDNVMHVHFADSCGGGTAYLGRTFRARGQRTAFLIRETIVAQDMDFHLPADEYEVYIEEVHPDSGCQWPRLHPTVPPAVPVYLAYDSGPA